MQVKKALFLGFCGLGAVLLIKLLLRTSQNDMGTIITWIFTIAGLFFSFWQTWLNVESARDSKMSKEIEDLEKIIAQVKREVETRDFTHDQQIIQLTARIESLAYQLDYQSGFVGKQLLILRNECSEHGANIAAFGKYGEINYKMTKSEQALQRLMETISNLQSQIQSEGI